MEYSTRWKKKQNPITVIAFISIHGKSIFNTRSTKKGRAMEGDERRHMHTACEKLN